MHCSSFSSHVFTLSKGYLFTIELQFFFFSLGGCYGLVGLRPFRFFSFQELHQCFFLCLSMSLKILIDSIKKNWPAQRWLLLKTDFCGRQDSLSLSLSLIALCKKRWGGGNTYSLQGSAQPNRTLSCVRITCPLQQKRGWGGELLAISKGGTTTIERWVAYVLLTWLVLVFCKGWHNRNRTLSFVLFALYKGLHHHNRVLSCVRITCPLPGDGRGGHYHNDRTLSSVFLASCKGWCKSSTELCVVD